jgi:hypothetical protein
VVHQEMEVVLYFAMSNKVQQNWREVFQKHVDDPELSFDGVSGHDFYSLYTIGHDNISDRDDRSKNLKRQASNYQFVGNPACVFVCPEAKPERVYRRLLTIFNERSTTVLDFFSGGQGLKLCMLEETKCLCFCDSEKVRGFLAGFANALRDI